MKTIHFKEVRSTNTQVKELLNHGTLAENTAILSDFQHSGRGQGDNTWYSSSEKNLLVSCFRSLNIAANTHFSISMALSTILVDFLQELNCSAKIKWPNDIYMGNKKIAGILIENSIQGLNITSTIMGIGININETEFPKELPNPTSLKIETSRDYSVPKLWCRLNELIDTLFDKRLKDKDMLFTLYFEHMFKINEWHNYKASNKIFRGKITGVGTGGELLMIDDKMNKLQFLHGEIEFINS